MIMTPNQPSILSSVLAFTGIYLLLAIILNVVLWALEKYAGFTMESSAIGVLPLVVGAMQSGQRYGTQTGQKPASGYAWTASFLFIVVSVVLSLAVLYGLFMYEGVNPMDVVNFGLADLQREGISGTVVAAVLGGILLLLWVGARFAFSWGASTGAKLAAKRNL
jgi:hypothetical protein